MFACGAGPEEEGSPDVCEDWSCKFGSRTAPQVQRAAPSEIWLNCKDLKLNLPEDIVDAGQTSASLPDHSLQTSLGSTLVHHY